MSQKLVRAINRTIEVVDVFASENRELFFQEVAFYRVKATEAEERIKIEEFVNKHNAKLIYAGESFVVIEKAGSEDDIDTLYHLLEAFGILEFIRSGRIAIRKECKGPECTI